MAGKWVDGRWINDTSWVGQGFGDDVAGGAENHPKDSWDNLYNVPNTKMNANEALIAYNKAATYSPHAKATHAGPVTINRGAEGAVRADQMAQLARLQSAAFGGGPSVANALGQESYDSTLKAQMAAPAGNALALGGTIGAGAGMHTDNAAKVAAMRAQEQQAAFGALSGAAYGARGADLTGDIDQARLSQQIAMANAGADQAVALGNQKASQQSLVNLLGAAALHGDMYQDRVNAELGVEAMNADSARRWREIKDREAADRDAKWRTGVQTLASVAMLASDERVKEDVAPASGDVRELLDAVTAYSYRYKEPEKPGRAPGTHVGFMAQDIENTRAGRAIVHDTPHGKMIDASRLASFNLAALAEISKRLDKIERR